MKKTFVNYLFLVLTLGFVYGCNSEAKRSSEDSANNSVSAEVKTTSQDQSAETAQASTAPAETAAMTFEETAYDFGTIQEGDLVKHTFSFTNTGKVPLIIQNATAQCGCTVPDWTRTPIAPGEKGEIRVEFNSKGKVGVQNKAVSITANTQPEVTQVTIKGTVESGVASMKGPFKSK